MPRNEPDPGKASIPQRVEHPSTYFVQDRSSQDELTRLTTQDCLLTMAMGGVLSEQPDPTLLQRVLDVGCGTGGWLLAMAQEYPAIAFLSGVDISNKMINYARAQAEAQGVSTRVEFQVMDALRMLEFPTDFFDLVNMRLGTSYLRKWDWPKLLSEFRRVSRREGVIRITESDLYVASNSPALTRLFELFIDAFYNAGHLFGPNRQQGITGELAGMMERAGLEDVQTRLWPARQQHGTPEWPHFAEDIQRVFRTALPFLRKWISVPDDYDELYQQMLSEIEQPGFVATTTVLTVWGKAPI